MLLSISENCATHSRCSLRDCHLVQAFVTSRLDYCNSIVAGLAKSRIMPLPWGAECRHQADSCSRTARDTWHRRCVRLVALGAAHHCQTVFVDAPRLYGTRSSISTRPSYVNIRHIPLVADSAQQAADATRRQRLV